MTKVPENLKRLVEDELYYVIQCRHCKIVFLVEDAVDRQPTSEGSTVFKAACPFCQTLNVQVSLHRLLLRVRKVMKPGEFHPLIEELAKHVEIEGLLV